MFRKMPWNLSKWSRRAISEACSPLWSHPCSSSLLGRRFPREPLTGNPCKPWRTSLPRSSRSICRSKSSNASRRNSSRWAVKSGQGKDLREKIKAAQPLWALPPVAARSRTKATRPECIKKTRPRSSRTWLAARSTAAVSATHGIGTTMRASPFCREWSKGMPWIRMMQRWPPAMWTRQQRGRGACNSDRNPWSSAEWKELLRAVSIRPLVLRQPPSSRRQREHRKFTGRSSRMAKAPRAITKPTNRQTRLPSSRCTRIARRLSLREIGNFARSTRSSKRRTSCKGTSICREPSPWRCLQSSKKCSDVMQYPSFRWVFVLQI